MEDNYDEIRKLKDAGMTDEMLTLYQHRCDTKDEGGQERLLRRFCSSKKQALTEDRQKHPLSC